MLLFVAGIVIGVWIGAAVMAAIATAGYVDSRLEWTEEDE